RSGRSGRFAMITGALAHGSAISGEAPVPSRRRVVGIVIPKLLIELAQASFAIPGSGKASTKAPPLGVLLVEGTQKPSGDAGEVTDAKAKNEPIPPTSELAAVNDVAARFGVRVGQTVAEAHAFVAKLVVREVTREQVLARLGEIAEVALGFGPTVSIESPDTVWVDV